MSRKKPYTLRSLGREEAAQVGSMFDDLYRSKLKSTFSRDMDLSATTVKPYQASETGQIGFSATGSATITKSITIREVLSEIVYANAHAHHVGVAAIVTDVTSTGITIECRTFSGTANFSAVVTASFTVSYVVQGSTP